MNLLNAHQVADIIGCTTRHIYNLVNQKKMPPSVKIGRMARWPEAQIHSWIAQGCPEGDFKDGSEWSSDTAVQGGGVNSGSTGVPW